MARKAFVFRISPHQIDRVDEALETQNLIIGWADAEGLLNANLSKDDFKNIIAAVYPDQGTPWAGRAAPHMWRFVHDMTPGDLVMVPRRHDIYFAEIEGDTTFDKSFQQADTSYRRTVRWLNGGKPIAKETLSPALVKAINSLRTTSMEITDLLSEVEVAANVPATGEDWTSAELEAVVADYRDMLRLELAGLTYNKSEHRRALLQGVHRSEGSIEFKHQNISAVLEEIGLPWIKGYKPRHNYQDALAQTVGRLIAFNEDDLPPPAPLHPDINPAKVFVPPPSAADSAERPISAVAKRIARKIDQAARDARNRELGDRGEEFVVNLERKRLAHLPHLAERVSNHAKALGDGLGYDVLSFDEQGGELHIEVKTTLGGIATPFYISDSELRAATERGASYRLYRVFGKEPQVFVLEAPLTGKIILTPVSFRVTVGEAISISES